MTSGPAAMKRCSLCKTEKPISDFSKNKLAKDGKFAWCKPCANARARAWMKAHPERRKANYEKWAAANPERKKELRRDWQLRAVLGITREDYDAMHSSQEGRCAICDGVPVGKRILVVDHCHGSGQVRGLLCSNCNSGLGLFSDDPPRLRAAADYLERFR